MEKFAPFDASPAWEMMVSLASSERPQSISTCSSSLDQLMGGGFPLGYVTEIAGSAGCGKTQICFQGCVNVQLPATVGGIEGEAIYLDSECTFVPSRITDMAKSLCSHFGFTSASFSPDKVLSRIYYHRILDPGQLLNVVRSLDQLLKSKPQIKLVVVDSVAAPLRHEFEDYTYRSEYLAHVGALLAKLAAQNMTAVVVTNQMTAKLPPPTEDSAAAEIPSLGKAWASVPAMQIVIGRGVDSLSCPAQQRKLLVTSVDQKARWGRLNKMVNPPVTNEEFCTFQITTDGIRDV